MKIIEESLVIPITEKHNFFEKTQDTLRSLKKNIIRFNIVDVTENKLHCEISIVLSGSSERSFDYKSLFNFVERENEIYESFNAVMIVPTGIGASIGGHAGDASTSARLLSSVCDTLITHPNVLNASDIMELPQNCLYVEGSTISRLLMGGIGLQKVRSNRVLVVLDKHPSDIITNHAINSVAAARSVLGLNCSDIIILQESLKMSTTYSPSGKAVGTINDLTELMDLLQNYKDPYDAVAISSVIDTPSGTDIKYFKDFGECVNPWGGVEAMLTHSITDRFDVPSAHAPMLPDEKNLYDHFGIVDPRKAAETISTSFLYCVLKGLHKSPRIIMKEDSLFSTSLSAKDISCLVLPENCIGLPTLAAVRQNIPIIVVKNNTNSMKNDLFLREESPTFFIVDNYLEAAGIMVSLKEGICLNSIRRPISLTNIINNKI